MANTIGSQCVIEKLGFKTLEDEEIRQEIYLEICGRIENELMRKRNKIFGWTDSVDIDIKGESRIDTYWVIVIDGSIIQIDLEYDGIGLSGNSKACRKLEKQILEFVEKISQTSILRKVKTDLMADQQAILEKWKKSNKARKK
jgi:hypothetical protein